MFERDKEELRQLGIPLETGRAATFYDEIGYRIRRQDYEPPEIQLAPDEAAMLGIAPGSGSRPAWRAPPRARCSSSRRPAARSMARRRAPGLTGPSSRASPPSSRPSRRSGRRSATSAGYLQPPGPGRSDVSQRELEPWGVVNRRAARTWPATTGWGSARVFRMSRITGLGQDGLAGASRSRMRGLPREVKDWHRTPPRDRRRCGGIRAGAGVVLCRWAREVTPETGAAVSWGWVTLSFADAGWSAGT